MDHPSGGETQVTPEETRNRVLKANKSCVICRVRKIKCDAPVVGVPCSSCTSRQCVKDCVLPVRKGRTRKAKARLISPVSSHVRSAQPPASDIQNCQSPRGTEPELLYLNILNDSVETTTESSQPSLSYQPSPEDSYTPWNRVWTRLSQLEDIDKEYLVKKGVLDLPSSIHVDTLIKTYFGHVYPFSPVINRVDFIHSYQTGDCSLFLLWSILTAASLHVPANMLSACGFASRSAAQESFFTKARLLHDFAAENDPLLMLQGSLILSMVILDYPTDRDFGYWFHNAIRLATKLELHSTCIREDKTDNMVKLYRRIWWALYSLDVFHVFINTRRSRILENSPAIKIRIEDDWDAEDVSEAASSLLPAVTPQQRVSPVVHCEISRMFGQYLQDIKSKPQQDPRQMLHTLDIWRKSLAEKMHVDANIGTDMYFLNMKALSYRFECILCRLMQRRWRQSQYPDWSEWARQRLQSAIMELDTIAKRVLTSGTLQDFPISFITTLTALLALHIESALNPAETDLVRSMAQISISQTMLVLNQGNDIPVLKRALPVFEEIIAKKNLYLIPPNRLEEPTQSQLKDSPMVDAYAVPRVQDSIVPSQIDHFENDPSLFGDFLGFGLLDEWQIGQMDFIGQDS